MANLSTIAGFTLIVGLAGGFFLGRALQTGSSPTGLGAEGSQEELDALRQRLQESETARQELEARLSSESMRAPMGRGMDSPMSGGTPGGMSGMGAMLASQPVVAAENPRPPVELLVAIHDAVAEGNWDLLTSLQPEVAAHGSAMTSDLVSLLANAESLAAMESLAEMLAATGDPAAVPALQELLRRESDSSVRTAAIQALGAIPDASSVGLLAAEFSRDSGSAMPPSVAASSLGAIGTPDAIAALQREMSEGDNPMVRMFGLNALAEKRDPELAGFLLTQATRTDASNDYRTAAIRALGQTGNQSYVAQLEVIAFSPGSSRSMQESAKQAINQIMGRQVYPIR